MNREEVKTAIIDYIDEILTEKYGMTHTVKETDRLNDLPGPFGSDDRHDMFEFIAAEFNIPFFYENWVSPGHISNERSSKIIRDRDATVKDVIDMVCYIQDRQAQQEQQAPQKDWRSEVSGEVRSSRKLSG